MFDYDEENSHCRHTLSLSVFHDGECRADLLASVSELVTPEDLLQLQLEQFFCRMKMDRKMGDHIWQQIADKVGAPVHVTQRSSWLQLCLSPVLTISAELEVHAAN